MKKGTALLVETKKSQTRLIYNILIGIVIISIFSLYFISADIIPGDDSGFWIVSKKTGNEAQLIFWTLNAKDKKTELGWIVPDNDCTGWTDKYLFNKNNGTILDDKSKSIILKCESAKCSGKSCYHISLTDAKAININDYIKLGNESFEAEYILPENINKTYNSSTKTLTYYHNNTEIATFRLITPKHYYTSLGYNYVAIYEFTDKVEAINASHNHIDSYKILGDFFINESVNYDLKYQNFSHYENYTDYGDCQYEFEECNYTIKQQAVYEWINLTNFSDIPVGEPINISLWTNVSVGKHEWVPTYYGVESWEFASYENAVVDAHGASMATTSARLYYNGMWIEANANKTLVSMTTAAASAATRCFAYLSDDFAGVCGASTGYATVYRIANTTVVNHIANFTIGSVNFTEGLCYYICCGGDTYGTSYTRAAATVGLPIEGTNINWTWRALSLINDSSATAAGGQNNLYDIESIYTADYVSDISSPIVTLETPINNSNYTTGTQIYFNCSTTDNINLANITFKIWNSTKDEVNTTTTLLVGISNSTNFTYTPSIPDTYLWNCLAYNNNSLSAFATNNKTINAAIPTLLLTINSPANISYNASSIIFNVTGENPLEYCNFTFGGSNYTMTNVTPDTYNYTNSSMLDGQYASTFWCNDSVNTINNTAAVTFIVDTTFPEINFSTGTAVNYANVSATTIFVNTTWNETHPDTIIFRLHNATVEINVTTYSTLSGDSTNITWYGLSDGNYTYNVTLNDTAGNSNYTITKTITLDSSAPNITLISPADYTNTSNLSINFTVNTSDKFELKNITLWVYNSTGDLFNSTTISFVAGTTSRTIGITVTLISDVYKWFFSVFDWVGNQNTTALTNYTLTIDNITPEINYSTGTAVDYANISATTIFVNTTWNETNPSAIVFRLHNATVELNVTTYLYPSGGSTNITWYGLTDGNYTYNVTLNDTAGNVNNTLTRTITLEATPPKLTFISPINGSNYNTSSLLFNISANKVLSFCKFTLTDWATNYTMTVNGTYANYTNGSISDGDYVSNYWCNDTKNNINKTETINFTIDTTIPQINYSYPTPSDGTYQTFNSLFVNVTWNETKPDTVIYRLYNSTGEYNVTNKNTNNLIKGTSNYSAIIDFNDDTYVEGCANAYINFTTVETEATNLTYHYYNSGEGTSLFCWNYTSSSWRELSQPNSTQFFNDTESRIMPIECTNGTHSKVYFDIGCFAGNKDIVYEAGVNGTYSLRENQNNSFINFTNIPDGSYTYNVTLNDTSGNKNTTLTRTIIIDTLNPNASLVSPVNYTNTTNLSINFTVLINDSGGIKNATLYVYNSSGDLYNTTVITFISGVTEKTLGIIVTLVDDVYTWFYQIFDWVGHQTTTGNFTLTVDNVTPEINYSGGMEIDYANITGTSIFINTTWNETNPSAIMFELFNSTNKYNYTYAYPSGESTNHTFTTLGDGTYTFNVTLNDTAGSSNTTLTRHITLDNVNPKIDIPSPLNQTYTVNNTFFWVNSTEWLDTCKFTFDAWTTNYTMEESEVSNDTGLEIGAVYRNAPFEYCTEMKLNQTGILNITLKAGSNFSNPSFRIRDENQTLLETINLSTNTSSLNIFSTEIYTGDMTYGICIRDIPTYSVVLKALGTAPVGSPYNYYVIEGGDPLKPIAFEISMVKKQIYYNSSMQDGHYHTEFWCNDSADNVNNTETRDFEIDTIHPILNITYPSTQIDYHKNATNLTFNWTFTELNPDTCILDYSGINFTVNCTDNSSIYHPVNITNYLKKNITFWMNDTFGNTASFTRNWTYKFYERNTTFSNWSYEGDYQTFRLNMTTDNASRVNLAYLVYNGSSYLATKGGSGTELNFTKSINVPMDGDFIESFTWNVIYGDSNSNISINSTYLNNQTLIPFNLVRCNSSITFPYYNFTFKDEINTSKFLNASTSLGEFVYYINNSLYNKTYTFVNLTENPSYKYCFTPPNRTMYVKSVDYDYYAGGYPIRSWGNSSVTIPANYTINKTLWLLSALEGQYVTFQVSDTSDTAIEGASIIASKIILGNVFVVGNELTDATGRAVFFLYPGSPHSIIVSKENCTGATFSITPTETTYAVTLNCLGGSTIGGNTNIEGIRYSRSPFVGGTTYISESSSNLTFDYYVVSLLYDILRAKFELYYSNGTFIASNESIAPTTSCNATQCYMKLTLNVSAGDDIKARYFIAVNNTDTGETGYIMLEGDAHWRLVKSIASDIGTVKKVFTNLRDAFTSWRPVGKDPISGWDFTALSCEQYHDNVTCIAGGCYWDESTGNAYGTCYDFNHLNRIEYSRIVFIFLFMAIILTIFGRLTGYDLENPGSFLIFITILIALGTFANGITGPGFFYYNNLTPVPFLNNSILLITVGLFTVGYGLSLIRKYS